MLQRRLVVGAHGWWIPTKYLMELLKPKRSASAGASTRQRLLLLLIIEPRSVAHWAIPSFCRSHKQSSGPHLMLLSSAFLAPHRALNGKTAARQTPRTAPVRSVPRVGLCRAQAVQPGSQAPQKASTQQRTLQFQESSNGATPGPIFSPKSVAIIGASERQTSVGYKLLRNILRDGYTGRGALRVPTIMGTGAHGSWYI